MRHEFLSSLARRNRHNLRTLRQSPAAEISGALGDLGTLLPLMIALALQGSINLPSTLVFSGLFNIITGVVFGIPLPVQPMKAIAASALSTALPLDVVTASGALVSLAVLLLSATGLLRLLTRHIPVPIVKGIQLGAALRLITSGADLILPLAWLNPPLNSRLSTLLLFAVLFLTQRSPPRYFPYALALFTLGLCTALLARDPTNHPLNSRPNPEWEPPRRHDGQPHQSTTLPNLASPRAWSTALSQLPLTTLNSVLAVSALAAELFPPAAAAAPDAAPGVTSLGVSVGLMNLASCWFGAMPVCHGAGGLAAQYRFGARSGASVVLLGAVKVAGGLWAGARGGSLLGVLGRFPGGVLGVMVVAAGLELGKVGAGLNARGAGDLWEESTGGGGGDGGDGDGQGRWREVGVVEQQERWMVMMVTAAGIVAFRNDAVGFLAGCCCHGAYKVGDWAERRRAPGPVGERRPLLR